MPNYRRLFVPGATYFFTVVTYMRQPFLTETLARTCLHNVIDETRKAFPFEMPAIVLLPDHFHMLMTLPPNDDRYPTRLGYMKKEFTKAWIDNGGAELQTTSGQKRYGRRGVWQPRYWEHLIEDEDDYENHFHYIHYNPVKHGYVQRVRDWPYSSFHRHVIAGIYPIKWACAPSLLKHFATIDLHAGE